MKFNDIFEQENQVVSYKDKLKEVIKNKCKEYFSYDIEEVAVNRRKEHNTLRIDFKNFASIYYDSNKTFEGESWLFVEDSNVKFFNVLNKGCLIKIVTLMEELDKIINGEVEIEIN